MEQNVKGNAVAVKDIGQVAIQKMLAQVNVYANEEGSVLSDKEKTYAVGIISSIDKVLKNQKQKTTWGDLDVSGCQLQAQIRRYCRLNLSFEDSEIFADIRNNGNTNKKDITLKMQYQGLEKLMITWCGKKIKRFIKDVVCQDDVFEENVDLNTGLTKLKHEKYKTSDINYRNDYKNIIGAYAIAYVEEDGEIVPYVAYIDKNRIERARNSATTKMVWDKDTRKMVIKTAVWELYAIMKPFMQLPLELKQDLEEITKNDVDFNKDYINADISEVKNEVKNNIGTKELEATFDTDENGVVLENEDSFAKSFVKEQKETSSDFAFPEFED